MRLGIIYGRRQEEAKAIAAFNKAQALYEAQGRAEVCYQRGAFLSVGDKLTEAQEQFRRALDLSLTTDNKPQQIKILLQLGGIFYSAGESLRGEQYSTRAIELARSEQLDNLTTNGLIDIGNALFLRGEYSEAEKRFEQALQIAKANKGRRAEARALLSLGSLLVQQGDASKALSYLEPALAFYRQGNFRRETSQALLLLASANEKQGNNEAALESFNEQLQLATQVNDMAQVAHTHAAIGLLFDHQERFTEALKHFDELQTQQVSGSRAKDRLRSCQSRQHALATGKRQLHRCRQTPRHPFDEPSSFNSYSWIENVNQWQLRHPFSF